MAFDCIILVGDSASDSDFFNSDSMLASHERTTLYIFNIGKK